LLTIPACGIAIHVNNLKNKLKIHEAADDV
jgi:hypothetical protein